MLKGSPQHTGHRLLARTPTCAESAGAFPVVKINGVAANPPRWPDGSYSVQGAAAALGVTSQTVFKWLLRGRLTGRQLAKGQPWQITLPDGQIAPLAAQMRRTRQSAKEAS